MSLNDPDLRPELDNDTLTLDMSKSWTNNTVTYGSINKTAASEDGVPDLNDGFLFPAADNQSFFQFGGETNWLFHSWLSPPTAAYQFTLSGQGNGSWSVFNSGADSGINNITRPTHSSAGHDDGQYLLHPRWDGRQPFRPVNNVRHQGRGQRPSGRCRRF